MNCDGSKNERLVVNIKMSTIHSPHLLYTLPSPPAPLGWVRARRLRNGLYHLRARLPAGGPADGTCVHYAYITRALAPQIRIQPARARAPYQHLTIATTIPTPPPPQAAELAAHNDATVTPSNVETKEPAETTRFPTPTKKPRPPGTITSEDRRPSFGRKASDRKLPGAAGRAASQVRLLKLYLLLLKPQNFVTGYVFAHPASRIGMVVEHRNRTHMG